MSDMLHGSHFSLTQPNLDIQRSHFNRNSTLKTSFSAGQLIPIYVDEMLPGDTFEASTSVLCRMSTPIYPVMDDAYLDYFFFFVPNRLVWEHSKQFFGESNGAWTPSVEYTIPQMPATAVTPSAGSIYDYMGLPLNKSIAVNALPFRAYNLIWNEWFRDENLQDPVLVRTGDSDVYDYKLLPVNKYHDYFTSCLPAPQKGAAALIPVEQATGLAPVVTGLVHPGTSTALHIVPTDGGTFPAIRPLVVKTDGNVSTNTSGGGSVADEIEPNNLWAQLGGDSSTASGTINQLRQAFAVQRMLERDARGGSRYTELIRAHFGVTSPDSRLQRPEYLGGASIPINVEQVLQTSSTDDTSPQGNTAAYSKTVDSRGSYTYSATEHGYIIGVACVRTRHTYQQGLNRLWSRKSRYDFYWPALANLGEQAVLNKEIYVQGSKKDEEVFGYQEAWAEYRYKPSIVTGGFRHDAWSGSLDSWSYSEWYASQPYLSSDWIKETSANIDRTLAVQSTAADQFLLDWYFKVSCYRPMPVYSIPGLADHH